MAVHDPLNDKDTVVTPGPDRCGKAEMSHVSPLTKLFREQTTTGKHQPLHLDQARSARLGSVE